MLLRLHRYENMIIWCTFIWLDPQLLWGGYKRCRPPLPTCTEGLCACFHFSSRCLGSVEQSESEICEVFSDCVSCPCYGYQKQGRYLFLYSKRKCIFTHSGGAKAGEKNHPVIWVQFWNYTDFLGSADSFPCCLVLSAWTAFLACLVVSVGSCSSHKISPCYVICAY